MSNDLGCLPLHMYIHKDTRPHTHPPDGRGHRLKETTRAEWVQVVKVRLHREAEESGGVKLSISSVSKMDSWGSESGYLHSAESKVGQNVCFC